MEFCSFIAGRARVQLDELVDRPGLAKQLEAVLARRNGIIEARANPTTARLLLRFVPAMGRAELERLITEGLQEARRLERAEGKVASQARSTLWRVATQAEPHYALVRKLAITLTLQRVLDSSKHLLIGLSVDAVASPQKSLLGRLGIRGTGPQLLTVGLAGGAMWTAKSVLDFRERLISAELTQRVQHELRVQVYERIQSLDMSFIDRARTGGLVSVITGDIAELESLLESGLSPIASIAATAVTTGIAFLTLSPRLALVQALVIPLLIWGTTTFVQPARKRFRVARERAAELSSTLVGNIEGLVVIRSFATEKREAQRIAGYSERVGQTNLDASAFISVLIPGLEMGVGLGFLLTLLAGSREMAAGRLTPGSFNTLAFMSLRLLESVAYLGDTVARMQRSLSACERIFQLLDQRPTIQGGTRRLPREQVAGTIRFDSVEFSYGGPRVLHGISLALPAGKTTGIVGGTGAGKSTLLKLLLRLYEIQGGRIELDGIDIRELRMVDLRRAIALVGQDVFLFHGTVRENIAYGAPGASQAEIDEVAHLAAADGFIAALPRGYDTIVGERGVMLSGGQRQRISIARALLTRAPIIALDEATSAVDNETEEMIQRALMETTRGRTRIVIAHRLSTIRHADNIYVLHNGAVVEEGRHEELLARGQTYANLWRVQTGERKHP